MGEKYSTLYISIGSQENSVQMKRKHQLVLIFKQRLYKQFCGKYRQYCHLLPKNSNYLFEIQFELKNHQKTRKTHYRKNHKEIQGCTWSKIRLGFNF